MQGDSNRQLNALCGALKFGRRYPIVAITVVVGLVGMIFWLAGAGEFTRWVFSVFAIIVAAIEAVQMIKQLRKRIFGIDVLAIVAIVSTVLVGEFFASIIIVLMVSGG